MWYSSFHDMEQKPTMVFSEETSHDATVADNFRNDEIINQRSNCFNTVTYPGRDCHSSGLNVHKSTHLVSLRRTAHPLSRGNEDQDFKNGQPSFRVPEYNQQMGSFPPRVMNSTPMNPRFYQPIVPFGSNVLSQRLSDRNPSFRGYHPRFSLSHKLSHIHHPRIIPSSTMLEDQSQMKLPLRELQNRNIRNEKDVAKPKMLEETQEVKSNIMQNAAADAAEILLGLRTLPVLSSTTVEPHVDNKTNDSVCNHQNGLSPPNRLSVPEDASKLNSMHCFLRSDLLELFVIESTDISNAPLSLDEATTKTHTGKDGSSRRVGLRCVHCAQVRLRNLNIKEEAPMAVFYPKCITELYRLVTSWQRVHLRKCRNIPPSVREIYEKTKEDKSRGKTQWWVTSARKIGLVDSDSKAGGICFVTTSKDILNYGNDSKSLSPSRD
jgi:hypothetical protein